MVEESINLQVLHWPTPQGKVPQGDDNSWGWLLRTFGLFMDYGFLGYFCCVEETKGLLEKMEDVSGSFFKT